MARDRDLVYEMQLQLNTRGRKEQKRREEVSIFEVNIFCRRGKWACPYAHTGDNTCVHVVVVVEI